jgi:DNA invertase Pin-like site-specific DNA recombinase
MPTTHSTTYDAPTPCVNYAAKSTEDKRGSIPTQIADCHEMAKREDWEVVGEFKDEGFSAYKRNRGPGLEQAKRAAADAAEQHGEPCMLLAQHSDRFARGAGDRPGASDSLAEVWHAMRRKSVHLRSTQNDYDMSDPVLLAVAAKRDYEDSKRKSAATKAGKKRRAERGDSTGPLLFGYRLVPKADGDGKDRVLDPDESPLALRAFHMLDEGRSIGSISRWLIGQGVTTKRGNVFDRNRVRLMLLNPWYGGKVRGHGEVRDGNHEPLLPWTEYERITSKLGGIPSAASRGGRPPYEPALLTGVMRCAHCGRGIWQRKNGKRRRYVCGNVRHASGLCEAAQFDAQLVEEAVVEHLDSLFVDLGAWIARLTADRNDQRDGVVRALTVLNDRRAELAKDEEAVRDVFRKEARKGAAGAAEVVATEVERIEVERAELDAQAADLDAQLAEWDGGNPADEALDWWNDLGDSIRGEVVGAKTVKEANAALRERFAAIFVRSPQGGTPRLDFVLKDRPPGAPLVTSRLWADAEEDHQRAQDEGCFLVDFISEDLSEDDLVKQSGSRG